MNTYINISKELKSYFSKHPFFKILLPLDMFIVYGCAGAMALNMFISIGSLLSTLVYYGFFVGLLLAYSNLKNKVIYTGLFIYAGSAAFQLLRNALFHRFLDYGSLFVLLIFGFIGYRMFTKE
ncbi:UNVERIFIED_CONTAM: hypothetical protein Cloal_2158 [Acetivibrio alkalicellulosi]